MKYALLTYPFKEQNNIGEINIGDYVQSIAARQFLPKVDLYLDREFLDEEVSEECKCIMNGWYMHGKHWPPNPQINPLFVAFHINSEAEDILLCEDSLNYLKKHEPIGCRDRRTERLLKEKGIDVYFSACLTLTLGKTYKHTEGEEILFVDPYIYKEKKANKVYKSFRTLSRFESYKKQLIKEKYTQFIPGLSKFEVIPHVIPKTIAIEEAFSVADKLLNRYSRAKLVVTSRIHCALPCLAMGTPVVYIHNVNSAIVDDCRLDGILELFKNIIYVDKDRIYLSENFDLTGSYDISKIVSSLSQTVENFIRS